MEISVMVNPAVATATLKFDVQIICYLYGKNWECEWILNLGSMLLKSKVGKGCGNTTQKKSWSSTWGKSRTVINNHICAMVPGGTTYECFFSFEKDHNVPSEINGLRSLVHRCKNTCVMKMCCLSWDLEHADVTEYALRRPQQAHEIEIEGAIIKWIYKCMTWIQLWTRSETDQTEIESKQ